MHRSFLGCVFLSFLAWSVSAGEPDAVVLDSFGSWRIFNVLKTPEIAVNGKVESIAYPKSFWLNGQTPSPPADWTAADFDDSTWLRGPTGMASRASFVSNIYLRGRFLVADPTKVKPLRCTVAYHGGVKVFLNGEEIGRKHLAAGAALAEEYPLECFVNADGELFSLIAKKSNKPDPEADRRVELRRRTFEVEIPPRMLRQGVNVLAVEVVRAPYHKLIDEKKQKTWTGEMMYNMAWNTCEILEARLAAPGGSAAGFARPADFQVLNGSLLRTDFVFDGPAPGEILRPISLSGARNGAFSAKTVVISAKPIRELRATVGELRGPGGVLPASAVQVRYALPGGAEYGVTNADFGRESKTARTPTPAEAISILSEEPPKEYPIAKTPDPPAKGGTKAKKAAGSTDDADRPAYAVAPVWLTVRVPADAKPGAYEGKLSIRCDGEKAVETPVRLEVADWALPEPEQYKTWVEVVQSPDTLQVEYDVPAWSDKHFELIARSFRLMREVGSGVLYLPLIRTTNYGNEETIVRWKKKGEKDYEFDFSVMDRYLDAAEKNLGKPKLVCFIVWDIFLLPSKEASVGGGHGTEEKLHLDLKDRPTAPSVTLTTKDPATGQQAVEFFPNYFTDADTKKIWTKLFGELRKRMKQRGLEEAMMLGWFTDFRAQQGEVDFWNDVTGGLPWVSHAHFKLERFTGKKDVGIKPGYMTSIHDVGEPEDPAKKRKYGWQNPVLHAQQLLRPGWRGEMDMLPGTMWSTMTELTLVGGQRGYGRLGGDTWRAVKDKKGRRAYRVYERYPWSVWNNLELCCSLFAPGPDGAIMTSHFEQFREGVEACEARVFLEQALTDNARRAKLGADLVKRCEAALDERLDYGLRGICNYVNQLHYYSAPWMWKFQSGEAGHAWFQGTDWRGRDAALYALAAEVEKAAGRPPAGK